MNDNVKFSTEDIEIIETILKFFSPIVLEVNRTHADLKADFEKSQRTGQCHVCLGSNTSRLGISYLPEGEIDPKIRYHIVANNKFNCLLENPSVISTERFTNEEKKIFAGGVRQGKRISCVSGFHPKLDEALAIILGWLCFWDANGYDVYLIAEHHTNPFVAEIISKAGGMENLEEWIKKEVL